MESPMAVMSELSNDDLSNIWVQLRIGNYEKVDDQPVCRPDTGMVMGS